MVASRSALFSRPCTRPTLPGKRALSRRWRSSALARSTSSRFLDQRADPVDARAGADHAADRFGHLADPLERKGAGVDRLPAGRLLGELGDVEVAIGRQHQGARDRRGGHHQQVDGAGSWTASAMRWCTPKRCCSSTTASARSANSTSSCTNACVPTTSWIVPSARPRSVAFFWREPSRPVSRARVDAGRLGERRDGRVVLAGQQLGRRHQRRLRARFDGGQHGEEGDQRSCRCRRRPAAGAPCARAWPCRRRSPPWRRSGSASA